MSALTGPPIINTSQPTNSAANPPNSDTVPPVDKNESNKTQPIIIYQQGSMYSVFHTVIAIFAIMLSFKCNKGFDFGGFLMACCCPYIYIIYKFMNTDNFCGLTK